jgi:hypothetical protein
MRIAVSRLRSASLHATPTTGRPSRDEVAIEALGEGEIRIAARGSRVRHHAGIARGIYRHGELDRLRDEWER